MTTRPGYVWDAVASEWVEIGQSAVVAPVSYQSSAPSSPATGDIWIDSDDEVPGITSSLNYRWRKIATGGETSLSGNDASGLPLAYNPGYEQVYLNGVLLYRGSDYTATTGNTITGLTALTVNDTIEVLSFVTAPIGDTYSQAVVNSLITALPKGSVAQVNSTTGFTTSSSTLVDVTGMSVTFTGSTARKYKATFTASQVNGGVTERARLAIVGTNISQNMNYYFNIPNSYGVVPNAMVVFVPTSNGTTTVKIQFCRDLGSTAASIYADAIAPMQLLVEDIGPV
jgi:hypothetical protein